MFASSEPTTGAELCNWLSTFVKKFAGMHMGDQELGELREGSSHLVNLDNADGGGTHWACFKVHGKKVLYYDSIGLWPTAIHTKCMKDAGLVILSSDSKWQRPSDLEDNTCGQRACIALYDLQKAPLKTFAKLSE